MPARTTATTTRRPIKATRTATGRRVRKSPEDTEKASSVSLKKSLAHVPAPHYAKEYVHRSFDGVLDFDIFDKARMMTDPITGRLAPMNVLIEGPTGPGKTTSVRAYASAKRLRFYRLSSSSGTEPSQIFGKYIPAEGDEEGMSLDEVLKRVEAMTDEEWKQELFQMLSHFASTGKKQFVWQDGPVTDIIRGVCGLGADCTDDECPGAVILLNEVNFIPERISTVLFSLLDAGREIQLVDHRAEVITAHPGILIVADMNPDYEGTRPLNKALRNRFAIQLDWQYDSEVEKKLVHSAALRSMAEQIRTEAAKGTYETPVATNMLMEFERLTHSLGVSFAISNFVTHFLAEERSSIKVVCDTWRDDIEQQIKDAFGVDQDELEDWDKASDERKAELRSKYEGKKDADGNELFDPEWGVRNLNWVFEDEDKPKRGRGRR